MIVSCLSLTNVRFPLQAQFVHERKWNFLQAPRLQLLQFTASPQAQLLPYQGRQKQNIVFIHKVFESSLKDKANTVQGV